MNENVNKILNLLKRENEAWLLDCGCGDGELTRKFANRIGTENVYGIDLDEEALKKAEREGIRAFKGNLNERFPLNDEMFDVIISNQVIEHLYEIDNFVKEVYRVLKPKGYALISTENLSSWHNIFALLLGYQDFSHHVSSRLWIGNPLSPHYLEKHETPLGLHMKIFAYQSLKELLEIYGFNVEKIIGAGYYPLPKKPSAQLSLLDPRHAHFIIAKARKTL